MKRVGVDFCERKVFILYNGGFIDDFIFNSIDNWLNSLKCFVFFYNIPVTWEDGYKDSPHTLVIFR
jgi:hypothetical protein